MYFQHTSHPLNALTFEQIGSHHIFNGVLGFGRPVIFGHLPSEGSSFHIIINAALTTTRSARSFFSLLESRWPASRNYPDRDGVNKHREWQGAGGRGDSARLRPERLRSEGVPEGLRMDLVTSTYQEVADGPVFYLRPEVSKCLKEVEENRL